MPQIPTWQDLGRIDPASGAQPASINPNVAYDIGRSGEAWAHAMNSIAHAFASLANKKNASETNSWLSEQKINTLTQEDNIRRNTEMSAASDGSGYEGAPLALKSHVEEAVKSAPNADVAEKYKMFAAERVFETGRWAANTSQKKLRESTVGKLDTRLDEMTNLTTANPEMASAYLKVYEDDIKAATGTAITPSEADLKMKVAKSQISRTSLIERARKDPASWAKAVAALEGIGVTRKLLIDRLPQDRITSEPISNLLETGSRDPFVGVGNVSGDSKGTHSYGNYGLNSGGSAQEFVKKYGGEFNLTANPGTKEFDAQWKNAAKAAPVELHNAELKWYNETIAPRIVDGLKSSGVPDNIANDPRVKAYFGDRLVQYGPASIENHAKRIAAAVSGANSVEEFLGNMSKADLSNYRNDFPSAIKSGVYPVKGHQNRVAGREKLSLQVTGDDNIATVIQSAAEKRNIPTVDGSIQPSELLDLDPKDYHTITAELRPYIATDVETRLNDAIAALQEKGAQNVVSESDIATLPSILGVAKARKYTQALSESKYIHDAVEDLKRSTPADRIAKINALIPNGNIESLAAEEKRRYEIYVKVNDSINEGIKKNPYEWAVTQNVSGVNAYKDIVNNSKIDTPEALKQREKGYDTIIKIQEGEGIKSSDIRIVSQGVAEEIATKIMNANPQQASSIIEDMHRQYGKHFNVVWRDALRAGLPRAYAAMSTADARGQNALVEAMAYDKATATDKKGKGGGLLADTGVKRAELDKALTNGLSDINNVFNSPELASSYRDAVEKMALYKVMKGASLDDAVKASKDELFLNKYKIYRDTIAVPVEHDNNSTEYFLRYLIDGKNNFRDTVIDDVYIGDENLPKMFGVDAKRFKKSYISAALAGGKFVGGDDGIKLIDSLGGALSRKNADGEIVPIVISWETMRAWDKAHGGFNRDLIYRSEQKDSYFNQVLKDMKDAGYVK